MTLRIHLLKDVLNLAVRTDDEGGACDSPDLFALHIFFFHHAEGLGHFLVGIGEQAEWQVKFLLKFLLRFRSVGGDAEQHGASLLHLLVCVAEPASFNGSTRGVGARIKIEDHGLAAQILQRDVISVLVL